MDITTLAGVFANTFELQQHCNAQHKALLSAIERISGLEAENKHLKTMLESAPVPELSLRSTEQLICEMEISKLKDTSMTRSLTLEETKRFDLLVKNLLLSKGAQKDIDANFRRLDNASEAKLIEFAKLPDLLVENNE